MARSISFDVLAEDKASKVLGDVAAEVTALERRIDGADGTIDVDADTSKARKQIAQVDAQLARLNAKSLKVDAEIGQAQRKLQILLAEAKEATGDRKLKIDSDIEGVRADLRALAAQKVSIDLETVAVRSNIEEISRSLDRAIEEPRQADVDISDALASIEGVSRKQAEVWARRNKVLLDIGDAEADVRRLSAEMATVTDERRKVEIDLQMGRKLAEIALLKRELKDVESSRIDVDAVGAFAKLAQVGTQLRAVQTPITIAIGVSGAVEVLQWIASVSAGLASLGAVGVASGGIAAASFAGIGDALDAMGQKADTGGAKATASASAIRSATRGVEQAQRDLRDAYDGVQAAEREVEASKRGVAEAERGVERASRDAEDAVKGLYAADLDITRAEQDLEQARQSAIRTLQDYDTRTKGMALSQKDASLSVREAEARLNQVMSDEKATSLQRERAALSLEQARQREADLTIEATRLAEDKAKVDAKGIDQSDQMVSAQARLESAHDRQRDAAQRVVDTQQALSDAQQKVGDAQQKVADSMVGVQKAHEKVELATQRLADSQLALREAMAPKGGGGTQVDKLREAMERLTPEGQRFVEFLKQLQDGELKQLQDASQANFLPGLQSGIEEFLANLGDARDEVSRIAGEFGGFFDDIGPAAGRAAAALLRLADLGAATTFDGLADSVTAILDRFTDWANSQSPEEISRQIRQVGNDIKDLWTYGVRSFRALQVAWELLQFSGDMFKDPVRALLELYEATRKFADVIPGMKGTLPDLSGALDDLEGATRGADSATSGLEGSSRRLEQAQRDVISVAREQHDGFLRSEEASIRYGRALDRARDAIRENGAGWSTSTEKGRENRQALLDLIQASNDTITSLQNQGASVDTVRAKYQEQRQKLIDVATQMTGNRQKAQEYVDKLLAIPSTRTTTVVANTANASNALQDLQNKLARLNGTLTVNVNTGGYGQGLGVYKSSGGWVGANVSSATPFGGGPRGSDTVPGWLDPNEFVVRASAAKEWGPLLELINAGASPDEVSGSLAGYAGRGIPAQRGGSGEATIVFQITNAVVGQEDALQRAVVAALGQASARGLLPPSLRVATS